VAAHARGDDGWGRYTAEVVSGVRARGVTPVLVTAESAVDPSLGAIERHAILDPPFARRLSTPRSLLRGWDLRRIAATCDLVHCTVEPYAPLVALGRPRGVPYVQTVHGTWGIDPLQSAWRRPLFGPAFRRADRLVFQSRFTRDWMARLIALPPHVVLTGGVRVVAFEAASPVDLPGWTAEGPIVLSVGAVKGRKGHRVALEAAALARAACPGLRYVVIGAAALAEAAALRARATALGFADHVHILGRVPADELVAWYRRADVLLLLPLNQGSSFEGLGLVYLEAAAAGTPSIGSLGCGAAEAILDGETGFLVPQDDPGAAAAALVRLLSDHALRACMGAAARQRARELSWDALAGHLVTLYRQLTSGRPPDRAA
jgi:glycosyltransferase involved in cell wall biosynthesis